MTKIWISIVVTLLVIGLGAGMVSAREPGLGIGVKAGINFANTSGDNWFSTTSNISNQAKKTRVGLIAGGFLTLNLSSAFAIEPEILYTQKGAQYTGVFNAANYTMKTRLDYLEIPILLQLYLAPSASSTPKIYAGPVASFKLSTTVTGTPGGLPAPTNSDIKSTDWGTVFGAGVDFATTGLGLSLEARYTIGLQNLNNTPANLGNGNINLKNGVVSLMLGLGFEP